jgi:tetratricopeptide (TPR) repeat protein
MLARIAAVIALLLHHASTPGRAQFLPSLQAGDPREFDSYLAVLHSTAPDARLKAADRFAAAWPQSELLPHVHELRFDAQRERGDVEGAIQDGERALQAAPGNVTVAVRLAGILATAGRLEEAERRVEQAQSVLANFRVPRSVPFPEWQAREAWIRARAAAALGLVAFKRDRVSDAVARFEQAVALSPEPADHLRLGRLYKLSGRIADARRQFKLAAAAGDKAVQTLAEAELASRPR